MSIGNREVPRGPVHVEITSDTDQVCRVREAVNQAAREAGFDEQDVSAMVLALDEAVCNVIKHAYDGQTGQPISVRIDPLQKSGCCGLEFTIRDRGKQVDPSSIVGRDLADIRPGGLGTHIMRTVMDEVEYTCLGEGGMQVRLLKFMKPNPSRG